MNILINRIEDIIENRGIDIKNFDTDFRTSIQFELLMQDPKFSIQTKIKQALRLYYIDINKIKDYDKALEDIIWFYIGEKEEITKDVKNNRKKQIYSYEFDDELIYAAFKDQYRIDLQDVEYLHWWKFKAMFSGLKKSNFIVEIMGYRSIDLNKIKDKNERSMYKELQQQYALPDMRTQAQKEADFGAMFWKT